MAIQIGAKPDSGFDDPIGMLKDCHRRIEHFVGILGVVAGRARGRGLSGEEIGAVQAALHYFREGGRRHTADEEQSLFPRLRAAIAADECAEIAGLEQDHGEADGLHAAADALYTRWIDAGRLSQEDSDQLARAIERLGSLYREHIALEDNVLFPRAAERLSREALAEIGLEFRARRA